MSPDVFQYVRIQHFQLLVITDVCAANVVKRSIYNGDIGSFWSCGDIEVVIGSAIDKDGIAFHDIFHAIPFVKIGPIVSSNHQEKLMVWVLLRQFCQGGMCVGGNWKVAFEIAHENPFHPFCRQTSHFVSFFVCCCVVIFVWVLRRDHQPYFINQILLNQRLRK